MKKRYLEREGNTITLIRPKDFSIHPKNKESVGVFFDALKSYSGNTQLVTVVDPCPYKGGVITIPHNTLIDICWAFLHDVGITKKQNFFKKMFSRYMWRKR